MWTLREMAQGKPIDRPIHPMLVHFPIAFYIGSLGLDVLSPGGVTVGLNGLGQLAKDQTHLGGSARLTISF